MQVTERDEMIPKSGLNPQSDKFINQGETDLSDEQLKRAYRIT